MFDRRCFLKMSSAGVAASLACPQIAFADAPTDKRFIMIFLRGGMDGLHALSPYADNDYKRLRPILGLNAPGQKNGVLDLDGYFGLHASFAPLKKLYASNELSLIPAASTGYRNRSHFDGQNVLENGSGTPYGAKDGWLNRAILGLNEGDRRLGLALGPTIPVILQGDGNVQTWANSQLPEADEDFLKQLGRVYGSDPLFTKTLEAANMAQDPNINMSGMTRRQMRNDNTKISSKAAANLLSQSNGPRIAVLEIQGWDTHFDQERRLSSLFEELSEAITTLKSGLGPQWQQTAVMVVSEFGRTAAENANRGTDHGTGGLAMLAGGAIKGGKIAGEWPGLSSKALYEGRDVLAANSYEGLFKSMLISHLGLEQSYVEDHVFPNSQSIFPMEGLF